MTGDKYLLIHQKSTEVSDSHLSNVMTDWQPSTLLLLTFKMQFVARTSISGGLSVGCLHSEQGPGGETEAPPQSKLHPGNCCEI